MSSSGTDPASQAQLGKPMNKDASDMSDHTYGNLSLKKETIGAMRGSSIAHAGGEEANEPLSGPNT